MALAVPLPVASAIAEIAGSGVTKFSPATGGCINHGGMITTADGRYFIKWNDSEKFPGMFDVEAKGLALLRETRSVFVPRVIRTGVAGPYQYLMLEHIEEGRRSSTYWETFGTELAELHKTTSRRWGLDHDNYIGSLPQRNSQTNSWTTFFVEQRLKVQLDIARRNNLLDGSVLKNFHTLFDRIPSLLPDEPASLLHGDLWGGNIMTTGDGQPCLIDPAVYFGHREVDLAMTQLFGGFDNSFLDSYSQTFPLLQGFRDRFDLYNLYPLLVHVNLFGRGYVAQVMSILDRFV